MAKLFFFCYGNLLEEFKPGLVLKRPPKNRTKWRSSARFSSEENISHISAAFFVIRIR